MDPSLPNFSNSLVYVNELYNRKFGKSRRRVIAHVPFLLNKSIIKHLQNTFPIQFKVTSSHKFREPNDMQFAFSYKILLFYFIFLFFLIFFYYFIYFFIYFLFFLYIFIYLFYILYILFILFIFLFIFY